MYFSFQGFNQCSRGQPELVLRIDEAFTLAYQGVLTATAQRINETSNILITICCTERKRYAAELLQQCDWNAFEEILIPLGTTTRLGIKTGDPARFTWLVEHVTLSALLAAMHARGHMRIALHSEGHGLGEVVLDSNQVLASSLEHVVGDISVQLTRAQWIKMQLLASERDRMAFTEAVVSGKEAGLGVMEMDTVREMFADVSLSKQTRCAPEIVCLT